MMKFGKHFFLDEIRQTLFLDEIRLSLDLIVKIMLTQRRLGA